MPAAVAIPLITSAITAGTTITAAAMSNRGATNAARTQADASREAARLQQQANDKAIAAQREEEGYQRQRTAAQDAARAPYVNASNQSLAALSQRLNLPAFDPSGRPPMVQPTGNFQPPDQHAMRRPEVMPGAGLSLAEFGTQAKGGPAVGTVMMVAPNGEQKAVPADQVAFYEARGAKRA